MAVPEAAAYFPAAQFVQVDVAEAAEYLPAAHGMQLTSPEDNNKVYDPASQYLHSLKGDTEILPAGQTVQTETPEVA